MKNVLIGIDVGTSGTKAAVVDTDGKILGEALVGYPVICLENGWAEQDALLWEQAVYRHPDRRLSRRRSWPESGQATWLESVSAACLQEAVSHLMKL